MASNVIGMAELSLKLNKISAAVAKKHLRSAAMYATAPTVKAMKAAAPRGTKAHRTWKGRLVAPGFLSRSVKRVVKFKDGRMSLKIGVRGEAFYGVTFLDEGTKETSGKHWFKSRFEQDEAAIISRFSNKLRERILAAAK